MRPQLRAAAKERGFDLAFRHGEAPGKVGDRIQIPVPAQKQVPLFLVQRAQKAVDGLAQRQIVQTALRIVRRGDALLQLRAQLADVRAALQAPAVAAAVERDVAGDARQKRIQVFFWIVRGDGVPRLQVRVVFALLGGLHVLHDPVRQRAQAAAVFLGRVADRRFVARKIQVDNGGVVQSLIAFPCDFEGPSPE